TSPFCAFSSENTQVTASFPLSLHDALPISILRPFLPPTRWRKSAFMTSVKFRRDIPQKAAFPAISENYIRICRLPSLLKGTSEILPNKPLLSNQKGH